MSIVDWGTGIHDERSLSMRFTRYSTTVDYTRITLAALAGLGLGAAAMYLLDPDSGRRRRAAARDKTVSAANDAVETVQNTARDLGNRARGVAAETRGAIEDARSTIAEKTSGVLDSAQRYSRSE